jgi:DNA replication protein DnaC
MGNFHVDVDRSCEKHGPYIARCWTLPGGYRIESSCPVCREDAEAEKTRAGRESALFEFRLKLASAGIGARYYDSSFDNYRVINDDAAKALETLRGYTDSFDPRRSSNLIMFGNTGYGKTHLACAVARELLLKGFSVTYLPVLTMFSQYQDIASYTNKNDDSREAFFARMRAPDLLILDEFGITSMTPKEQIVFHRVIDERYNRNAPICLVGNTDVFDFTNLIGERAERRVMAGAKIIKFNWPAVPVNHELFAVGSKS